MEVDACTFYLIHSDLLRELPTPDLANGVHLVQLKLHLLLGGFEAVKPYLDMKFWLFPEELPKEELCVSFWIVASGMNQLPLPILSKRDMKSRTGICTLVYIFEVCPRFEIRALSVRCILLHCLRLITFSWIPQLPNSGLFPLHPLEFLPRPLTSWRESNLQTLSRILSRTLSRTSSSRNLHCGPRSISYRRFDYDALKISVSTYLPV
mmetsp:Transcript_6016/g.8519  ORF Transcript_6016/g.8519 Transcript_6016/m.8519 type:complete len:208 (-) Transcript_6016:43-666(-)